MNVDEIVSGLVLELRRGTLILLVLNQLQEPKYGYNLSLKAFWQASGTPQKPSQENIISLLRTARLSLRK